MCPFREQISSIQSSTRTNEDGIGSIERSESRMGKIGHQGSHRQPSRVLTGNRQIHPSLAALRAPTRKARVQANSVWTYRPRSTMWDVETYFMPLTKSIWSL
jgi:hypothetical protein